MGDSSESSLQSGPSTADKPRSATAPRPLGADERILFECLRVLRKETAQDMQVTAFMVFSDKTLREMARARPTTQQALLAVKGVGPAKYEEFGEQFIQVISTTGD